jgi:hypothetical protein
MTMRSDMSKVLVERPRERWGNWIGGGREIGFRQRLAGEDVPVKVGMKYGHVRRKWLNENLAPLKRFLQSSVGRPWDKVYAEISATMDRRSTVQEHIFQHLFGDVLINVRAVPSANGKFTVFEAQPQGRNWVPVQETWSAFFVDPRNGILRETNARTHRKRSREYERLEAQEAEASRCRVINDMEELRQIDGDWYRVLFAERDLSDQSVHYCLICKSEVTGKRHKNRYAVTKQQLSAKEIKRLGLPVTKNDEE